METNDSGAPRRACGGRRGGGRGRRRPCRRRARSAPTATSRPPTAPAGTPTSAPPPASPASPAAEPILSLHPLTRLPPSGPLRDRDRDGRRGKRCGSGGWARRRRCEAPGRSGSGAAGRRRPGRGSSAPGTCTPAPTAPPGPPAPPAPSAAPAPSLRTATDAFDEEQRQGLLLNHKPWPSSRRLSQQPAIVCHFPGASIGQLESQSGIVSLWFHPDPSKKARPTKARPGSPKSREIANISMGPSAGEMAMGRAARRPARSRTA